MRKLWTALWSATVIGGLATAASADIPPWPPPKPGDPPPAPRPRPKPVPEAPAPKPSACGAAVAGVMLSAAAAWTGVRLARRLRRNAVPSIPDPQP